MGDSYYRHSKSHSSRSLKDDLTTKSKIRKSRHHKETSKNNTQLSKTPPLPKRSKSSIQDLLKQRESLKKELEDITKLSENNIKCPNKVEKKRKYDGNDYSNRSHKNNNTSEDKRSRNYKQPNKKPSENIESYALVESEDEETIIEERRKQRKVLIEKLKEKCDDENRIKIENNNHSNEDTTKDTVKSPLKVEIIQGTTDMFSDKDDFISLPGQVTQDSNDDTQLTDNWDDSEGYYNVRVGDIINNSYTIKSIMGQGVFANVVRAQDGNAGNTDVAIKIIRNNNLMYQTGVKEIATLKELNQADPEGKYHCVKMLTYFMHKGHLCIVLEPLYMDLRCVIKKYGKHHGLHMKALISYSRQLLLALRLLKKVGVIHADLKPDNILVNEKKNILKVCDFGSAAKIEENEPTPYLVSRFYRAPEIILGMPYNHNVDTWSTACTIYEMATGKIMFTGSSNNKMLKCFMDLKGRIPSRLIRKGKFKDQHFNYNNNFLLHKKDEVTGREKNYEMANISAIRDLEKELRKSYKCISSIEDRKIIQLKDLLDKMLMLDPRQRLSNSDCLKHQFIQENLK